MLRGYTRGLTGSDVRLAEVVLPAARRVLASHARRIRRLGADGQLTLTGGSSVPGALTRGDIDLHLRVSAARFSASVEALRATYAVVHPEIWTATLATFADPHDRRVGIAVTPIGSEHDRRFVDSWERLRADPDALAAYNAMKRAHAGDDPSTYERAKSDFFDRLLDDRHRRVRRSTGE